jgi:arylformamidase
LSFLKKSNSIQDFSHEISPDTNTFPVWWHKKVEFEEVGTLAKVGRRTTHLHLGTHVGTHIDAPSHFIENGLTIDQLSLEHFLGKGIILDFSCFKAKHEVQVEELKKIDLSNIHGKIIIFNFSWSKFFGKTNYYNDQPYFSIPACEYILSFQPKLIGYDMAMPDNPKDNQNSQCDSPAHKLILGEGVPLLENMKIVAGIEGEMNISCTPLKLKNLDGSPVRCIGW